MPRDRLGNEIVYADWLDDGYDNRRIEHEERDNFAATEMRREKESEVDDDHPN